MKLNLNIECDSLEELRSVTEKLSGRVDTPASETPATPTVEDTPASVATGEVDVDKSGMPYDSAIHATPASMKTDGTWKVRKGQAAAAKAARQAFLASGGGVEAPVVEDTPAPAAPGTETRSEAPAAPGAPGAPVIPEQPPVSRDEVMTKATQMFNDGQVTAEELRSFYKETVGTEDTTAAYGLYENNETACRALMDLLVGIEG